MKNLKVLYLSLYLPMQGFHGGGNRMFKQIKYLANKHDIYLISFLRDWEEQAVEQLRPFCKEINAVKVKEKNFKSHSLINPGFIKNYYSKDMEFLLLEKIKQINPDLVQFEYLPMAQYKDGLTIKSILTEHQLGFLYLKKEMNIEKNAFKRLLLYARYKRLMNYELKALRKFDSVVFLNNKEAECSSLGFKSFVSSMGVDTKYFVPDKSILQDTDLIFIGNFDSFQNVDSMRFFVNYIWPLIRKNRPNATFKIVGYKSKEKLDFLKNEHGIEIIGYKDDVRDFIDRAKVFVVPARLGAGMKGKVLEALSMEKPVVATSLGVDGYRGDILKAIRIADTPKDFADNVLALIENEDIRKTMGFLGRNIVEMEYKWESVFSKMDKIYEALSNNN